MQRYNEPLERPDRRRSGEEFAVRAAAQVSRHGARRVDTSGCGPQPRAAIRRERRARLSAVSEVHERRIRAELPRHDRRLGAPQRPRLLPLLRRKVHDARRPHARGNPRDRPGRGRADSRRDGQDHSRRRSSRATSPRSPRSLADRPEVLRQDARGTREGRVDHPEADRRRVAEAVWPAAADAVRRPPRCPTYIAPQATFAYYQPPTGDGRRAGFFYINTFNLPSRPLYMLESLSLHEAVPGHHLQTRAAAGARRPAGVPQVRRLHGVRRRLGAVLRAARPGGRLLQRSRTATSAG